MLKKTLEFSALFPRLTLFVLLLITVSSVYLMPRLQIDIAAQSMMVKSDPLWETYEKTLKTYGSDNVVIIFIHDKKLFTAEKLAQIKNVVKSLESLSFVKASSSLFNVPNFKEVDDYIYTKPFLDSVVSDQQSLDQILSEAVANPMVVQNLISTDGNSMAINLFLDSSIDYPDMDRDITQTIEKTLQPLSGQVDEVFQMGSSYIKDAISKQIKRDQKIILPVALAVLLLVLGFSLKRVNCSIVPFMTAVMSIALTLSMMAFMGVPVNVLTSIIPALLIIIGSTEDVHLLTEYHSGIQRGLDRSQAVLSLPRTQSVAISLAFVTTFIGFVSITVNDLDILVQFGWVVSLGLLINFIITVLFIPAFLQLFGGKSFPKAQKQNLYQRIAKVIFLVAIRYKKATLISLLLITGFFVWGLQSLQVNNNTLSYFPDGSDIQLRSQTIHEKLSGMQTFSIILDSGIEDTFLKVRYLQDVRELQQFIDHRNVFDKSFSFADFIMLINKVMNGDNEPSIPDEDELVKVYMGFVAHQSVKSYVSEDFSNTRIIVRHNLKSSAQLDDELQAIRVFIDEQLKTNLNVSFTGETVLTNRGADSMAFGQIQSLLLMIIVIFALVSLLYVDFRAGILAVVPNIFPVIVLFGVMGYLRIPLDTGTTMVAIIALGICVDDTIHFLSRYHHNTRGTQDVEQALLKTVEHEATPIITTSVALALGFATLTLSSFQPVANFGALSAMVMLLAAFSTFVLTPILLSHTRLVTVWDMLSNNQKTAVLQKGIFFKGLKNSEIKRAILSGNIKKFEQGDIIIEQGHRGTDMYVIVEGFAFVTRKENDGSSYKLGSIGPGELFGELALLSNYRRTARVTAGQFSKVLVIRKDSFKQLGRFNPRISMKLFYNLSAVISKRLISQLDNYQKLREELAGPVTKGFLTEQIEYELHQAKTQNEVFTLLCLDMNILKESGLPAVELENSIDVVTAAISEQIRSVDVFTQWDELRFLVLMPRTTSEMADCLPQRIMSSLESMVDLDAAELHLRSVAVESYGRENVEILISRVEQSLQDQQPVRIDLIPLTVS